MGYMEEQDKRRSDFLVVAFEATDGGSSMKDVGLRDIEAKLNITYEEAQDVFDYLKGEGLMEVRGLDSQIGLTHAGRVAVEDALRQGNPIGFRPGD